MARSRKSNRRQALAAHPASIAQNGAATLRRVAAEKAVLPFAADFRWLILAFHKVVSSNRGFPQLPCPAKCPERRATLSVKLYVSSAPPRRRVIRSAPKVLLPGAGWPVHVNGSLRQKSVLPDMDNDMSHQTKHQVLAKLRRQYSKAGPAFKSD